MDWLVIGLAAAGLCGVALAWFLLPADHWFVKLVDLWQPGSKGGADDYTREDLERDRRRR